MSSIARQQLEKKLKNKILKILEKKSLVNIYTNATWVADAIPVRVGLKKNIEIYIYQSAYVPEN